MKVTHAAILRMLSRAVRPARARRPGGGARASRVLLAGDLVTIDAIDASGAETLQGDTPDPAAVRITRSGGDAAAPLTVFFSRTGTAIIGTDFTVTGQATSAVIPAGQFSVDIVITPKDDALAEPTETITYKLLPNAKYTLDADLTTRSATVEIVDNEPVVSITALDPTGAETAAGDPADTATFRLSRTGPTDSPLTVNFTRAGTATVGTDYTTFPLTAVIPQGSDFVDVTVSPVDNQLAEASETVILKLTPKPTYSVDPNAKSATVTILDNEPTVTVSTPDAVTAETQAGEAVDSGVFRISRTGPTALPLTVSFVMSGKALRPTDYVLRTAGDAGAVLTLPKVTIPAGEAFIDVTLTPVDDALTDIAETAVLTLSKSTAYNLPTDLSEAKGTVTITDNEPVVSVVKTKDASEVNPSTTGKGSFTISRTGAFTDVLVVNYSVTGTATPGTDYATLQGSVTIPKGAASVKVDVVPVTDAVIDGGENVVLTIEAGAYTIATGLKQTATMTLADGPVAPGTLFGNMTFTQGNAVDNRIFGIGTIDSDGTYTSTNAATGHYIYIVAYAPAAAGQGKIGQLRITVDFAGVDVLLTLTFTGTRPDFLGGKTLEWLPSATGAQGTAKNAGGNIAVSGFFRLV